ncbi:MAG: serine/threonine protein kinase [Paludibacteraceae bacterium]|nr:serine/threonine protein kinase [Paludibacteraceae bacterium]MBO5619982.1 serine/threonine protein kinase [Paludibacteraceae bacterium]
MSIQGMEESSFILSPLSSDFSDVWSEPELLSSEGHNALYVATRFGRRYVLKALAEPYRESTPHIELLRKEFAIGVAVDHPNIVRLLDFGRMDSIGWYIRMEYIDGITLEQFLETKPSAAIRRRIIEQLLDALSCLHERQIIHRDIKPANILITRNGSTVKLIDFGVSDTDDYVTFKQPAGSMAFIAPEQLAGKPIDNRADIYSVGKIIGLLFPHRYRSIARQCTRTNPADRYSSCAQVLRAIRRIDRVRIWLPVSLLLLFLSCAAVWGIYTGYQHSELAHKENEKQLFVHVDSLRAQNEEHRHQVDSLRAQNEEHRHQVDSLNRVVDSLAVKANMPSQEEILNLKIKQIYQNYISRVEEAIRAQDIVAAVDTHPTPAEQWCQEMTELFASVGDDEELRLHILQAKGWYYAEIYLPFMDRMTDPLSKFVRSEADYKAFRLEQYF